MATAADIPLLITSEHSASERRITPAWSIAHLKARLEPITGVPASCQKLSLKLPSQSPRPIEAANEDATQLAGWPLQAYAEIHVGTSLAASQSALCLRCMQQLQNRDPPVLPPSRQLRKHVSEPTSHSRFRNSLSYIGSCASLPLPVLNAFERSGSTLATKTIMEATTGGAG